MYADLDYSAFANLNLRHFETESAEQRPPSLLPQTPASVTYGGTKGFIASTASSNDKIPDATIPLSGSMNKINTQTERSVPSAPVHEEQNPAIPMHEMVEKTLGRTGGVYDKTFRTVPIRLRVRTVKSYLVYYISILNLPQS